MPFAFFIQIARFYESKIINGMCLFVDGTRAARRREKRAPSLTDSTSDCAVWVRSWRTKRSGTAFSRFVLQTSRLLFVARNELAIATKSIASVLPHAKRTPWVPSNLCRGGTAVGETREEGGSLIFIIFILLITHKRLTILLHFGKFNVEPLESGF